MVKNIDTRIEEFILNYNNSNTDKERSRNRIAFLRYLDTVEQDASERNKYFNYFIEKTEQ